ncbi:14024_t:CDS:2, partial [Acaulospora colombiana]
VTKRQDGPDGEADDIPSVARRQDGPDGEADDIPSVAKRQDGEADGIPDPTKRDDEDDIPGPTRKRQDGEADGIPDPTRKRDNGKTVNRSLAISLLNLSIRPLEELILNTLVTRHNTSQVKSIPLLNSSLPVLIQVSSCLIGLETGMPAPTTPWTSNKSGKGHLLSDRIPNQQRIPSPNPGGKGKGPSAQSSKPQSPEVTRLQQLISKIQKSLTDKQKGKGPVEGCFCLARNHKLSPHVSMCRSCGLILCELNQPYDPCPFGACNQPLLNTQSGTALIDSLNEQVAKTIIEEEGAKRRHEDEERRAAGAFPQLAPSSAASHSKQPNKPVQPSGPHKVLSLTQKGAILTVRKSTPSPSNKPKEIKDIPPPIVRVPAPKDGPDYAPPKSNAGSWENLRTERIIYIPPPKPASTQPQGGKNTKKSRQKNTQPA